MPSPATFPGSSHPPVPHTAMTVSMDSSSVQVWAGWTARGARAFRVAGKGRNRVRFAAGSACRLSDRRCARATVRTLHVPSFPALGPPWLPPSDSINRGQGPSTRNLRCYTVGQSELPQVSQLASLPVPRSRPCSVARHDSFSAKLANIRGGQQVWVDAYAMSDGYSPPRVSRSDSSARKEA